MLESFWLGELRLLRRLLKLRHLPAIPLNVTGNFRRSVDMPYYVSDVNPDYTAALGLFQHLNTEELQKLLNDDGRVDSMVKDLQQVKNAENEREMLLASNKSPGRLQPFPGAPAQGAEAAAA
ncbi:hypothetical protein HPB48_006933 [Haemaphysalis longicornis]|uniref:VPS37 C-terminal domain-containing protein n=1 Tax=Haemaphysalis longicornis TaxID=44386 RepID=A0A9J6GFN6_HAELO|nr:hypothetical protein HPB48_006933 [Haemaphysalis longicornis]